MVYMGNIYLFNKNIIEKPPTCISSSFEVNRENNLITIEHSNQKLNNVLDTVQVL